jgi:hypothetical protein
MIFIPSELPGALIVEMQRFEDHRGFSQGPGAKKSLLNMVWTPSLCS